MLPDELLVDDPGCLEGMMTAYREVRGCMIAVREVPQEETKRYGIITPGDVNGDLIGVRAIVEKPAPETAPSRLYQSVL